VNDMSREDGHLTTTLMADDELNGLKLCLREEDVPVSLKPAMMERYIGIDQGIKTFSMVAVDKMASCLPKVVGAYQLNLEEAGLFERSRRLHVTDVLLKLEQNSPLFEWIRGANEGSEETTQKRLERADRVVVALEQISIENAYSKQFGKELGTALQRQFDVKLCIVKMSQPHVHRRNGPMFKLGDEIVEACQLVPPSYESLQTRVERKRARHTDHSKGNERGRQIRRKRRREGEVEDVEPSDSCESSSSDESVDDYQTMRRQVQSEEYRKKKAMSAAIFRYFIEATPAQQVTMQVEIDGELQMFWRSRTDVTKYDDLGDALLHALDASLCQASKYRQLIPASPTLNKNRTVTVAVLPDKAFWVTMECVLNKFVIEDFGFVGMDLRQLTFSTDETVQAITRLLPSRLRKALCEFDSSLEYLNQTSHIKIIVKQLKSYGMMGMSSKAAGALTNSTVKAMTSICDVVLPSSTLSVSNSKKCGWSYSRTCKESGKKIEVLRSSGKHLNAILSCLQWMKSNLADFVRDRPLRIGGEGRVKFFRALREVAISSLEAHDEDGTVVKLESIHLSQHAVKKIRFEEGQSSEASRKTFADLILIALDGNQQYISAVSANSRKCVKDKKKDAKSDSRGTGRNEEMESSDEGMDDI
jgi:hypothetical protein